MTQGPPRIPKLHDDRGTSSAPEAREPREEAPKTRRDLTSTARLPVHKIPSLADENEGTTTDQTAAYEDRSLKLGARASLTVLSGLNAGQVYPIDRVLIVGRAKTADIMLGDAGLSRQHARIYVSHGVYVVEDLQSTNGVRVNGNKVERATLTDGDRIQLGPDVVLRFAFLDDAEENFTKQLYIAATRDVLTQALNRRVFDERLKAELSYAKRHRTRMSIVLLDIDHFKTINDTHGHTAGDEVLRRVAASIQHTIRDEDVFARYGGEEFVILVRGETTAETAIAAERVRAAIKKLQITFEEKSIPVTVSAGVAELSECTEDAEGEGVLKLADDRLYQAKQSGRDRVCSG